MTKENLSKIIYFGLFLISLTFGCTNAKKGFLLDERDGQSYKCIKMKDGKHWMVENLNYAINGSFCYGDDKVNCNNFGRLYTREAAVNACPEGWHLPSDKEWEILANLYGGYHDSKTGKAVGNKEEGYAQLIKGGTSKFSALLGGYKYKDGYDSLGNYGGYWATTDRGKLYLGFYSFRGRTKSLHRGLYSMNAKNWRYYCRCIQD